MKVSVSAPSDAAVAGPRTTALPWPVLVIAALYLAAHLPSLAPSLEDIDSINFALGLRDFDPGQHQPHPPGYPVYIALGRASLAIVTTFFPSMPAARAEALALSIWSALGGAVALVAAWFLFTALDRFRPNTQTAPRAGPSSLIAVLLLAVAPLFWITGLRPMSDMPGLAAILAAQAFLLYAIQGRVSLVPGALMVALAAGIRTQSLVLTLPLLMWGLAIDWREGWRVLIKPAIAFVLGILAWAVPLMAASGGIDGYLRALGSQAGEDFAWVNMLWSNPTPRRLAFALYETVVLPWAAIPLAAIVLVTALAGKLVAFVRSWRALAVVCIAFGPYALFHLLFQETPFVRYALPLIPPVVWLAARAIAASGRAALPAAIGVAVYAAILSIPAGISYGRELHPAFLAIDEMAARSKEAAPAAVISHYSLFRSLEAAAPLEWKTVRPVRNYEWLTLVDYWRAGETAPIWFLADPRRTDLALIDPQSRRDRTEYRWGVAGQPELQGARPIAADWYRLLPPGWFLGEGWSLTPPLGGLVRTSQKGIDHRPLEAYVRRRSEPVTVMVGAHLLSPPSEPPIELDLSLEGSVVDSWTFDPRAAGRNFLRFIRLPAGIPPGAGEYAQMTLTARSTASRPTPDLSIRQFDVQPAAVPILGYAEGWHEDEFDEVTGRQWKWTSNRSVIRVVYERAVELIVRGESPLRYFDAPPTVRIKAGDRVISERHPDADFEWRITIPSDALEASGGNVAIEIDRVYVPSEVEGSLDQRPLGLRVFECRVVPASD